MKTNLQSMNILPQNKKEIFWIYYENKEKLILKIVITLL